MLPTAAAMGFEKPQRGFAPDDTAVTFGLADVAGRARFHGVGTTPVIEAEAVAVLQDGVML